MGPPGPLPPSPAPPRADCPKASRGGRTLALVPRCLSLSPQRRAPWHTFEFANPLRVRGLLAGGRVSAPAASQADTHQGTPKPGEPGRMTSYCVSTAWGGRTTPARARLSRHRRTDLGGLASLSLFILNDCCSVLHRPPRSETSEALVAA